MRIGKSLRFLCPEIKDEAKPAPSTFSCVEVMDKADVIVWRIIIGALIIVIILGTLVSLLKRRKIVVKEEQRKIEGKTAKIEGETTKKSFVDKEIEKGNQALKEKKISEAKNCYDRLKKYYDKNKDKFDVSERKKIYNKIINFYNNLQEVNLSQVLKTKKE